MLSTNRALNKDMLSGRGKPLTYFFPDLANADYESKI